jgi:predicted component of type VI protein secretion system
MIDMAAVRNVREDHDVTVDGRLVLRGATIDVPVEQVYGLTSQVENWQPADDEAQAAHDAASTAHEAIVEHEAPARNASLEVWQEYARALGATEDDLDGKTRGDLIDTYTTPEG